MSLPALHFMPEGPAVRTPASRNTRRSLRGADLVRARGARDVLIAWLGEERGGEEPRWDQVAAVGVDHTNAGVRVLVAAGTDVGGMPGHVLGLPVIVQLATDPGATDYASDWTVLATQILGGSGEEVCALGGACDRLTDVSSDGLKAYAQACGEEKTLEQLTAQGIDTAKIKRLANGEVDWRDAASGVASYEFGTNIDVRELVDDDNNIRWDKIAEAAGSVAAAAACTAYGAGAAAPVCGLVGGKLGGALYAVGDEFVSAVGDIFGSSTPVPPIQVPSPQQSVNLVAQFYLENLRGYLQGLAAVRGVALVAAATARMLSDMLHAATGETVSPNDMIRRMQHAGMSLPGGWTTLLRMNHSYDGYETATQDAKGRWQIATSELGLLHYAFGMNSTPFDAHGDGEIGLFFHGHDIDSQDDHTETQMFWCMATQGAPYVRFVSTSADSNDAPWPVGDLAYAWPAPAPAHCSFSTQNGGVGPTPPATDRYGSPLVYYDCFADTGHASATDGGIGGFAIGDYGIEVDVTYNDALRRLLVKPPDQQAQLRVAWIDSIRRSADVLRADIREAKAHKKPFFPGVLIHLPLPEGGEAPPQPWSPWSAVGGSTLLTVGSVVLGALGAWAAWRTYQHEPIVPPKVAGAAKTYVAKATRAVKSALP